MPASRVARRFNTNDVAMKNWTSSPPIVPIDKGQEKLVPRFHFAFPPPPPQVKFQRKPPSRFSVQSHRNFYIFLPIKINFSSSIDISSYAIEWIYLVLRGGGSKLRIAGISQLRLLHRALIAPGNFPNGVHRTIFSRYVGMYPFSKGKARATNEYTLLFLSLSLSRERDT